VKITKCIKGTSEIKNNIGVNGQKHTNNCIPTTGSDGKIMTSRCQMSSVMLSDLEEMIKL